ncbi:MULTISPECIES: hypothetical protein [Pseudomonas]|uniref:Uncharacterized protein n=2 Tax=Pseudomonas TaxID=286 RepID=A0A923K0V7_9PSED|nr:MULTISPECIES: hypothetical protein [Pseudomonas]MBI6898796.1 hypothetical protein [Pseudomonas putida]MBC3438158.1 hypothetical protein [Pseudomonas sp. BW16M2]MBV4508224.1 hypothetical protein [Pseudomonas peradeniyensis]MCU7238990.1 hypothetical protein [Pseudomonas peradeniyensis]MCU7282359.1 hypothetical protein [Pseudomonas peradeniyensis]
MPFGKFFQCEKVLRYRQPNIINADFHVYAQLFFTVEKIPKYTTGLVVPVPDPAGHLIIAAEAFAKKSE